MRVLHLLKTSDGAQWALRQMRELVRLGVEVHAALPAGGQLIPQYEAAGVRLHPAVLDLPVRAPWRYPQVASELRGLVAAMQPDVIHSHFVGMTLMMRGALGRRHPIPRVFQVPGPLHLEYAALRQGDVRSAGRPDYWIGSCLRTCALYRRAGAATERVFLSYYGCDLDFFTPRPPGKLRAELGMAERTPLVGMVSFVFAAKRYLGARRGIKGHEDLIDALEIVRRRIPNVVGVFAGGPWGNAAAYERQIREYARERLGDGAVFLGVRSDVPDLYADFDVAVHPSHSENLGGAAESLLLAVPTIATHVGGLPDIVHPGRTGWLVSPRDPAGLARAIEDALASPERGREMAVRGQALARQILDHRETAREVLGIYEMVVARHAAC